MHATHADTLSHTHSLCLSLSLSLSHTHPSLSGVYAHLCRLAQVNEELHVPPSQVIRVRVAEEPAKGSGCGPVQ